MFVQASSSAVPPDPEEAASKTRRHVKKLEIALFRCHAEIDRLEKKEMTLDDLDEEDSTYVTIGRYKDKCTKIYKKLAEINGSHHFSLGRRQDKPFKYGKCS